MLIKYIKSVLWRVAKRLSCIEDARCLKVKNEHLCSDTHIHVVVLNKAQEGLFVHFDTDTVRQDGTDRT
jgi:hypothetical protein